MVLVVGETIGAPLVTRFRIGLDRPGQPQTIPAHRLADDRA